jgi:hypothetical protein
VRRRALLLAGGALAATSARAAGERHVTVIYVGGWDCPYCTAWKNESKPKWITSELFGRVRYVEVESPRLKEAYQERYWPEDLRPVLAQIPHKSGTPRFLVVKDGKLIANAFGTGQWAEAVAAIEQALG